MKSLEQRSGYKNLMRGVVLSGSLGAVYLGGGYAVNMVAKHEHDTQLARIESDHSLTAERRTRETAVLKTLSNQERDLSLLFMTFAVASGAVAACAYPRSGIVFRPVSNEHSRLPLVDK